MKRSRPITILLRLVFLVCWVSLFILLYTQSMTTLTLESQTISSPTPFHFNFHVVATLHINADVARRLANRQIAAELSTGLGAREPELAIRGQQLIWRVPVYLSLPQLGDLGRVGSIDVDARTAVILTSASKQKQILQHAHRLYTGSPLPAE